MNRHEKVVSTRRIALFYACGSLTRDHAVGEKKSRLHDRVFVCPTAAREFAPVAQADVALIDATEDDAQAVDAFSQAAAQLGVAATAMYSECMHDGLEVFVRSRRLDVDGAARRGRVG